MYSRDLRRYIKKDTVHSWEFGLNLAIEKADGTKNLKKKAQRKIIDFNGMLVIVVSIACVMPVKNGKSKMQEGATSLL